VRYDAAIIGAGANGLTAAAVLTRAGLKTVVVERAESAGGRLVTDNFHPGFFASAFAERVPEIPASVMALGIDARLQVQSLPEDLRLRRDGALARIFAEAREPFRRDPLSRLRRAVRPAPPHAVWPGQDLATRALAEWPDLSARALGGRAADPALAGSALALLALTGAEPVRGGLGALAQAFIQAAQGAELRLGLEAGEVTVARGRFASRVTGLILSDGGQIEADAVISTLDLKRSTLSLFPWAVLPPAMTRDAGNFRMGGGMARLLLALKGPAPSAMPRLLPSGDQARRAFRDGALSPGGQMLVDPVSVRDPGLAPEGHSTLAVTLSCIPARLFDGVWTAEGRLRLVAGALKRIDAVLPGTLAAVIGFRLIAPPDIEERLGASAGDLDGGQLAPDQMLCFRPNARTCLPGYYLGSPSSAAGPLGTGAAGFAAATALLADRTARGWP
jgi:phytoene dehydrogenase-like protein